MRSCAALAASILLLLALPAAAQAQSNSYTSCAPVGEALLVEVSLTTCADTAALVTALLAQPPDGAASVLTGAGWSALRAQSTDSQNQHDLVAIRGLATLRIRRSGAAPDLDGFAAGRELLFARKTLVGGRRPPKSSALCTSAFLVRLRSGRLGGLSAAHCGGLRTDRTVQRRNAAMRRPPSPGIVLGRVLRILTRSKPLDALVLPVLRGANRPASAVIDRGVGHPPWRVIATARPVSGRQICMTGRTSGIDQCGEILGARARRAERLVSREAGVVVRCTTIMAAEGDSGGPIYTAPAEDGTVRAIGIATLIVRPAGDRMCFTAINPVLNGLGAKLVTATG